MQAPAIEATPSHRHTAHHFTLKVILIVSTLTAPNLGNAAVWPAYCQQSGGTLECTTDFKQAGAYSCDHPSPFLTATADECRVRLVTNMASRLGVGFVGIPAPDAMRDRLRTISYPNNGYANLQSYGSWSGNFGDAYSFYIMRSGATYTQGAIPSYMLHVDYACPVGWNIRPLPDANNSSLSTFNPLTEQPNIICTRTPPVVPTCALEPVDFFKLPTNDLCANSLEKGKGKDVDAACPKITTELQNQLNTFASKVAAANVRARPPIPYSGPSATIRNVAYQAHLRKIWDKLVELNKLTDATQIEECGTFRNKVAAEVGCSLGHCLTYQPSTFSNHPDGTAFDVPRNTINSLIKELTPLPPAPMSNQQKLQFQRTAIAGWLASPPSCNLIWGGDFQNPDRVHFKLP